MKDPSDLDWPEPSELTPARFSRTADGVSVAYYDLGGTGPELLLLHATGFCSAVMAPIAASLADRFHCLAIDSRAHGLSGRPVDGDLDWHGFALDVLSVVNDLGLSAPLAFGHSCGGAALVLAEEAEPGTFGALYCFEPVVFPGDPPMPPTIEGNPLSAGALRRRTSFASRQEALANFSAKPPFNTLRRDVLAAYVDNGFERQPDGTISLRCRREDEARIYALGMSHDAFARMPSVKCPVALACGERTDAIRPDVLAAFAERLDHSTVDVMPGLGHFAPLEDPDTVAASISERLDPSRS